MQKVIKNIPCTFNKPFENGKFASLHNCDIRDLGKDYANTVAARYANGIGCNSDNIVLVKIEEY